MKEKKPTTESFDQWETWAQRTYRTGGTQPPKSSGGLIAFLLVVIIFLCGISTALGMMNIRLFHQLTTLSYEETSPVTFPSPPCLQKLLLTRRWVFTGRRSVLSGRTTGICPRASTLQRLLSAPTPVGRACCREISWFQ